MYKISSLRAAITATVPDLAHDPDRLHIFINQGSICCRPVGASFEYNYQAEIVVLDYPHHPDLLILAIIDWLRVHQPDLLQNPDAWRSGFTFEADILNHSAIDLSIKLQLTENVRVVVQDGTRTITHLPEPPANFCGEPEPGTWEFYVAGTLVGTLTKPDASAPAVYTPTGETP